MRHHPPRHPAHGQSIVELLVGVAAGLIVVAATAALLVAELREQRTLRLEARLTQDLGSAADLIARDLRRAGHWVDAMAGVWTPSAPARANPYTAMSPATDAASAVAFSYSRDVVENGSVDDDERLGWRLRAGVVELRLGGRWQAVTDAAALTVTTFAVVPSVDEIDLAASCPRPCDAAASAAGTCPPRLQVRSLAMRLTARAAADARIARRLETRVRLRNDAVVGTCAA